ncbi:MAG: hypothetical protein OEZ01_01295 [Candidatus Heimdallarchaeota archaeon]|nr:hypothetical protein [Candidatus Heimdallarchaeota archaeon]MDH5644609.1 hypothetical protein [Candidatus Heimdallarchaeota archaeon]
MTDLSLEMRRLNFELEENPVNVIAMRDYKDLSIDGININLIEDHETQLPYWIAKTLEENNLVKIMEEISVTPRALSELAHKEGKQRTLTPIDSLLYQRVIVEIRRLRKESTGNAMRKLTSIEGSFNLIKRHRFRKILQMAMTDQMQKSVQSKLTLEENWLYEKLTHLYGNWINLIGVDAIGE